MNQLKQNGFYNYLLNKNLSQNTILAYTYSAQLYFELHKKLTKSNLNQYKSFLISAYKPQTVNLRLSGINAYLDFAHKKNSDCHS